MYTLAHLPRKGALHYPDRTAVVFENTRMTYKDLNERVNRLANALSSQGFRKGQRLAVLAENTHKYLEIYFAAAKLGMSITPLNFRLADPEITHILNDSESACLFVADGYEEKIKALQEELKGIRTYISVDNPTDGFLSYEELLCSSSSKEPDIVVNENDMAILFYTGGTTGLPKGVMQSHRNIMTGIMGALIPLAFTKEDATCFVLPLFHVSIWPAFCLLMAGGKVVINRKPDLNRILQLIQDEACTHINAVPTIYGWIVENCDLTAYDLSSLRIITYAGSPFPTEVLKKCIHTFGPIFQQAYGMTECVGGTGLKKEDHVLEGEKSQLLASAGKASLMVDVCIMDEDDQTLNPHEIGEVCIRGECVMMGYWKNPELTKKVIRDGWYHTGDMGYLDHDEYLFLVDRKSDMIVTGGENVYPQETESVLYAHEAVSMAAVVSAPDEKWGERVQAVVTLKPDMSVTEQELLAFCKERLAGYKVPKSIEFWESLPTTPVGKILRKDIKKKFWGDHERTIG